MFVVVRKENISKLNQPLLFESWMNAIFPERSLSIIINWLASYLTDEAKFYQCMI